MKDLLAFCKRLFDGLSYKVAVAPGSASCRCYCVAAPCRFIIRQFALREALMLPLLLLPGLLLSQTLVTESVETRAGQSVVMRFDDLEQIAIEVWEQPTIKIEARVSINSGENDDAFRITVDNANDVLNLSTEIVGKEDLPEKIAIHYGDQDHYFNTGDWSHPDVQAFLEKYGRENMQWMSHGPLIDITVKVFVPENIELKVRSKFGLVEMQGVTRSLAIHSEHGGLDLAVSPTARYDFGIACAWGEVYTNLDLDIASTKQGRMLKAEQFVAKLNGGGPPVRLVSEHGNVYLRAM